MRVHAAGVVAGVVVLALGAAGFVRGSVPQASAPRPAGGVTVVGATITASTGSSATGTFTVYNTTRRADAVTHVESGAGAQVSLPDVMIPAGANRVVHIVISQLFGPLVAGQTVDLEVDFRTAASFDVTAKVVAQARQGQSPQPSSGAPS